MPTNCGQLETRGGKNKRLVPVEPHVKSVKMRELSNAGVSGNSKTSKSPDPACYDVVTVKERTDLFGKWRRTMSNCNHIAYVGRSPDGARRVYASDPDPARAMQEAYSAACDYLKRRSDCGPLSRWRFDTATEDDIAAVTLAGDVA